MDQEKGFWPAGTSPVRPGVKGKDSSDVSPNNGHFGPGSPKGHFGQDSVLDRGEKEKSVQILSPLDEEARGEHVGGPLDEGPWRKKSS